jgi:hypothetical protein
MKHFLFVFVLMVPLCSGSGGTPDGSLIVDNESSPSKWDDFPEFLDLIDLAGQVDVSGSKEALVLSHGDEVSLRGSVAVAQDEGSYGSYHGAACRTNRGGQGENWRDYDVFRYNERTCRSRCSDSGDCKGYEYSFDNNNHQHKCELWKKYYGFMERKRGFSCYWKDF